MRLLALDQSSRTSGFAVFIDGELRDYGTFTMTDNSAAKISRLTYDNQQEIAMSSDKMIQIAELESIAVSFKKKKGVFRYYTAYIVFDTNVFRVTLNLFSDANGTRLYDINKITQITASGTVHGSSGYKYYKR